METMNKDCLFLIFDFIHIIELIQCSSVSLNFHNSINKYIQIRKIENIRKMMSIMRSN